MIKPHYQRRRAKAANLAALQMEIARHLRGRLDLPWSLSARLAALLERLLAGPGAR